MEQEFFQFQMTLLEDDPAFPSTRFQGSKAKLLDWIWDSVKDLQFQTALDGFGGTGCVSHMFKYHGKAVTYNDFLKFNWMIGLALVENNHEKITKTELEYLLNYDKTINYPKFIYENFSGIYFKDEENHWLDQMVIKINNLTSIYKQALAYFALFQACISKRPFNLFHRKNLYLRFAEVERSFGNKSTWDKPFDVLFKKFIDEGNKAVFSNNQENCSLNMDVFNLPENFDLVYFDPPYMNSKGISVDYSMFYHFLEGLVHYDTWKDKIDTSYKHKPLKSKYSVWLDKDKILHGFEKLFEKFQNSIIVLSYRSDGIPAITELKTILRKFKNDVSEVRKNNYKYVLSRNSSEEVLLIGI
jgi:adenine-specific DNA methylase